MTEAKKTEEKASKVKKSKRKTEKEVMAYGGVVKGSLKFETEGKYANKQTVKRECANDRRVKGHTFKIATSDLWQKDACDACMKHRRKERVKAKRAELRENSVVVEVKRLLRENQDSVVVEVEEKIKVEAA